MEELEYVCLEGGEVFGPFSLPEAHNFIMSPEAKDDASIYRMVFIDRKK